MLTPKSKHTHPRWPHGMAVLLVVATFPLIWMGGLVTTYDAGMAVEDWPTTRGYNLLLYPWQTWIAGPWDVFIEHGHRLMGALVGVLTITLNVAVWLRDSRRWMRWVALSALGLVLAQGILGGMRVIQNSHQLALIHGCVGPLFFALTVAIAAFTSRWWNARDLRLQHPAAGKLHRLAVLTFVLAYVQLILGAQLRHLPVNASLGMFRGAVWAHLFFAAVLTVYVLSLAGQIVARYRRRTHLLIPALGISLLLLVQLVLGSATWVVKYSWPTFAVAWEWTQYYTIQSDGMLQSAITTAHVANGSLILATAILLALRSTRLVQRDSSQGPLSGGYLAEAVA